MEIKSKVAIVTGVSQGIGLATVQALLNEGATVIGWGRTPPENFTDSKFHFIQVDVSKHQQVLAAFEKTMAIATSIDILINNAGLGYFRIFDELTIAEINEMLNTNVLGLMYCTHSILPLMKKHKTGHIINIASIAGTTGIPEGSVYCASKFAVRGFSQSLFKETRPFNVKVSCVYPGSVNTNFFEHYPAVKVNDDFMKPEEIAASIIHLLKTPENILPVDLELRPMRLRM
jgi:NADP-dependent 3-hydroxy acid dehydrogenase YdfG